jgi:D-lactate dehydrogenase
MTGLVREALGAVAGGQARTVVCDASSCTEGLRKALAGDGFQVVDAVTFVLETVLPRLDVRRRYPSVALHPTCSSSRLGTNADLVTLAEAIADEVIVPDAWGCCAFAGDRGLLHPELTASATQAEAAEVRGLGATALASCNRTCELGMTRAVGRPYRHLLELVDWATMPGPPAAELVLWLVFMAGRNRGGWRRWRGSR